MELRVEASAEGVAAVTLLEDSEVGDLFSQVVLVCIVGARPQVLLRVVAIGRWPVPALRASSPEPVAGGTLFVALISAAPVRVPGIGYAQSVAGSASAPSRRNSATNSEKVSATVRQAYGAAELAHTSLATTRGSDELAR